MEFSDFKKIIFNICSESGASVISFSEAIETPNFHASFIEFQNNKIYILCSENNDWAFSTNLQYNNLKFINCSELSVKLEKLYGIKAYTKNDLCGNFSENVKISEYDIKYWKPKTLGEGLFNWWD